MNEKIKGIVGSKSSLALIAVILFIILLVALAANSTMAVTYGDVNFDGKINVRDAVLVMKHVANISLLTANQQEAADVNGDGDIDIKDVNLIMQKTIGLIDKFPITIVSVEQVNITVPIGTSYSGIGFPGTVKATLQDQTTRNIQVSWSQTSTPSYNPNAYGNYEFKGELINLPSGVGNPNKIAVKAVVYVWAHWMPYPTPTPVYTITFNEMNDLEGVTIRVYSNPERTIQVGAALTTNSSGQAFINLANGTYYTTATLTGYPNNLDSFTVASAAQTVDFMMLLPPALQFVSAETNVAGTLIIITFDKAMADPAGEQGAFTFNIDGGADRNFTAAVLGADTSTIELHVDGAAIEFGDTVTVSYDATTGSVVAADSTVLASFINRAVTNNVPDVPVVVSATISPTSASYDLTGSDDVTTTVTWNDASSITGINDGSADLTVVTDYTIVGNTLTILDSYLSGELSVAGESVVLTISFDVGNDATFTITATDPSAATVTPVPTTITAGDALDLDVTGAQDAAGDPIIAGAVAVTVTSSIDGGPLNLVSDNVNFTDGDATIEISAGELVTAGTHELTVTIAGVSDANVNVTDDVVVEAGDVNGTESGAVWTDNEDGTGTMVITVKDQYENPISGLGMDDINCTNGFDLTLTEIDDMAIWILDFSEDTGVYTIEFDRVDNVYGPTDWDIFADGVEIETALTIEITIDLSAAIVTPAEFTITAGEALDLDVTGAQDAAGDPIIAGAVAVTVTSSIDGGPLNLVSDNVNFTAGDATIEISAGELVTAGTHELTVTIDGVLDANVNVTDDVVVEAGAINGTESGAAWTDNEDGTGTMTLSVLDQYTNPITGILETNISIEAGVPFYTLQDFRDMDGWDDVTFSEVGGGVYDIVFDRRPVDTPFSNGLAWTVYVDIVDIEVFNIGDLIITE